ncbi:MAG TPA: hemolysin family protein, partial [Alphaproteobacteria bacterium]|nr:hemolysin family protein [Alphaproteobacteria bacterium]
MTDTSISRPPRNDGGADQTNQTLPGLFRTWLRASLRVKSEASWRDTIEELIEDQNEPDLPAAAHERTLLGNILRLKDLTAYDVMVPRADIVALEVDTPPDEALQVLSKRTHSRVPVYRESLDDVVGMLHIKDVMARVATKQPFRLQDILRDVLIVAPSMPVLDLLLEMRESRRHLALVIDEFGGIDGLITIEDLVEEIVGEIEDEHDIEEAPRMVERPDGTFLADARLPIEEFEDKVGSVLEEDEREDIDTLGGLVFSIAGRIPARGELLAHPTGLEFEVVEADPRRIRRLRVRRVVPEQSA